MSDTLQKFKSSLNRGVTAISLKTSSSLEKAKIKTHIDSLTTEAERALSAAGEAAYGIWEAGETDYSALAEQFTLVQQKRQEIAQLQQEYDTIDARDNQILGTTPPPPAPPAGGDAAAGVSIVCPNCGSVYNTPVRFCRKCGNRLME